MIALLNYTLFSIQDKRISLQSTPHASAIIHIAFDKGFARCNFLYQSTLASDKELLKQRGIDGVYGKLSYNTFGECKLTLEKESLFLLKLLMPENGIMLLDE